LCTTKGILDFKCAKTVYSQVLNYECNYRILIRTKVGAFGIVILIMYKRGIDDLIDDNGAVQMRVTMYVCNKQLNLNV